MKTKILRFEDSQVHDFLFLPSTRIDSNGLPLSLSLSLSPPVMAVYLVLPEGKGISRVQSVNVEKSAAARDSFRDRWPVRLANHSYRWLACRAAAHVTRRSYSRIDRGSGLPFRRPHAAPGSPYDRSTRIPRSMHQIDHEIASTTNILDGWRSAIQWGPRSRRILSRPSHDWWKIVARGGITWTNGRIVGSLERCQPPLARNLSVVRSTTRLDRPHVSLYFFPLFLFFRWILDFSTPAEPLWAIHRECARVCVRVPLERLWSWTNAPDIYVYTRRETRRSQRWLPPRHRAVPRLRKLDPRSSSPDFPPSCAFFSPPVPPGRDEREREKEDGRAIDEWKVEVLDYEITRERRGVVWFWQGFVFSFLFFFGGFGMIDGFSIRQVRDVFSAKGRIFPGEGEFIDEFLINFIWEYRF